MLVNFHGVNLEVPDDTLCIFMDGRHHNFAIYAWTGKLDSIPEWRSYDKSYLVRHCSYEESSYTELDVSFDDTERIRAVTKPKNSLIMVNRVIGN